MRVVVTLEARFQGTPDGKVWCDGRFPFPRAFWDRYLAVFDEVLVVARVEPVPVPPPQSKEVTGDKVKVHALPYYVGPWAYLRQMWAMRARLRLLVAPGQCYILRLGSPIADVFRPMLTRAGLPYGVEVVGDPWEMFGPGGIKHPLRPLFRLLFTWQLKRQCVRAAAASYVTERLLQERYPAPAARVSVGASSIMIGDESFAAPRVYGELKAPKLVTVGSLEHPHKGTDLLLEALAGLHQRGIPATLELLGDGRMRPEFEAQARRLGVDSHVRFLGALPAGEAVRKAVAAADLFVLPSRADGLPRAMIEAMALGVFCVGSDIGGMRELLPPEWRVPVNRADLLADKLERAIRDPAGMSAQSAANFAKSKAYHQSVLAERRGRFYASVREQSR